MRLYIPNGSVASGRFISPRRRRRGGKYRSSGEDDFSAPEAKREARPTVPGLSFPKATDEGISLGPKAMCIFGNRIFISIVFLLSLSQNMAEILFRMPRIKERRKKILNRLGRLKNSVRVSTSSMPTPATAANST